MRNVASGYSSERHLVPNDVDPVGSRFGLKRDLSALRETGDAELLKVGETSQVEIPRQASRPNVRREGVVTRRARSQASAMRPSRRHGHHGGKMKLPPGHRLGAELRFALSRNLGLAPQSLLGQRVEFVWRDAARFKNLTGTETFARGALASFGVAVARTLFSAVVAPKGATVEGPSADRLRAAILSCHKLVYLPGLLSVCWGWASRLFICGSFHWLLNRCVLWWSKVTALCNLAW
jgi:hypothetical protein